MQIQTMVSLVSKPHYKHAAKSVVWVMRWICVMLYLISGMLLLVDVNLQHPLLSKQKT